MKGIFSDPWLYAAACFLVSMLVLCLLVYIWDKLNLRAFWRLVKWHPPRANKVPRRLNRRLNRIKRQPLPAPSPEVVRGTQKFYIQRWSKSVGHAYRSTR